jgi:hypothetical protein
MRYDYKSPDASSWGMSCLSPPFCQGKELVKSFVVGSVRSRGQRRNTGGLPREAAGIGIWITGHPAPDLASRESAMPG